MNYDKTFAKNTACPVYYYQREKGNRKRDPRRRTASPAKTHIN
jgi:hypothetical protein